MSRQSKQALEVKFISNAACARLVECPGKPGAALPLSVWLSRLHDAPPCLRRYLRTVKMSRQSKQALEVKFISNAACASCRVSRQAWCSIAFERLALTAA